MDHITWNPWQVSNPFLKHPACIPMDRITNPDLKRLKVDSYSDGSHHLKHLASAAMDRITNPILKRVEVDRIRKARLKHLKHLEPGMYSNGSDQ